MSDREREGGTRPQTLQGFFLEARFDGTKPAILFEDKVIDYQTWERVTDSLAIVLSEEGIGPGSVVSICLRRSEKLIYAVHAVVKAGAAYQIMNMQWPPARQSFVWEDSSPGLIIDQEKIEELLERASDIQDIPSRLEEIPRCGEEDVCAIYYTSGSTGTPKGAVHCNRSLIYSFLRIPENFLVESVVQRCDRPLGLLDCSFIGGFYWMILSFVYGKTTVLLSEEECKDIDALSARMKAGKADLLHAVPSMLQAFRKNPTFCEAAKNVRVLMTGGEVITPVFIESMKELLPEDCVLYGGYGSSETQGCLYAYDLREDCDVIGYPLLPMDVLLADPQTKQVVAEGQEGLLCIDSAFTCREYLNLPQMNQDSFLVGPDGKRYFIMQDIVRPLGGGKLAYVRRQDRMVKLNGIRVDLMEIEKALSRCPSVERGAVRLWEEAGRAPMLCGYFLGEEGTDLESLRAHLLKLLPPYMVPQSLMRLEQFPMTDRGKLDYSRLPAPSHEEGERIAPRNEAEELVYGIFSKQLGLCDFGVKESFFRLGGDSLGALLVLSCLRGYGWTLTMDALLEEPTVEAIARLPRQERGEERRLSCVDGVFYAEMQKERAEELCSQEKGKLEAVFPVLPDQRLYCRYQAKDRLKNGYWISHLYYREGAYDESSLREKLMDLYRRHPVLRARFCQHQGEFYEMILKEGEVSLTWRDLSQLDGPSQEQAISEARQERKQNASAEQPLLCWSYYQLSRERYCLELWASHLVIDGMGVAVLERELFGEALSEKEADPYLDYRAFREQKREAAWERDKQFWQEQLKDLQITLFPTGRLEKAGQSFRVAVDLTRAQTKRLQSQCSSWNVTLSALVYHLYAQALMELLDKEELMTISTTSGRSAEVLHPERIIGDLMNPLPLRMYRTDTVQQVQRRLQSVEEHGSHLCLQEIFSFVGYKRQPPLVFLPISELFPNLDADLYRERDLMDNLTNRYMLRDGCFQWEMIGDGWLADEEFSRRFAKTFEEKLLSVCGGEICKLSIVTPMDWVEQESFAKTLKSVESQNRRDLEWVIALHNMDWQQKKQVREWTAGLDHVRILEVCDGSHGPGAPRNAALLACRGDFLMFLDADDRLCEGIADRVVEGLEESRSDLCLFPVSVEGSGQVFMKSSSLEYHPWLKELSLLEEGDERRLCLILGAGGPIWSKGYRREMLERAQICFDQELELAEDYLFSERCYQAAGRILVLHGQSGYLYTQREDSTMQKTLRGEGLERVFSAVFDAIDTLPSQREGQRERKQMLQWWMCQFIQAFLWQVGRDALKRRTLSACLARFQERMGELTGKVKDCAQAFDYKP